MTIDIRTPFRRAAAYVTERRDAGRRTRAATLMARIADKDTIAQFVQADAPAVGAILYPLGRIDVRIAGGLFETDWTGGDHHAVRHRHLEARDGQEFLDGLNGLAKRHFVEMRRPDAGPHHMTI